MTTRERWIVYPLLFLALGTAIKPKLVPPEVRAMESASANVTAARIICRELLVVGSDGRSRIELTAPPASAGGEVHVRDTFGNALISIKADAATRAGYIETLHANRRPQTRMMSSATGGELVAYDNDGQHSVAIGHRDGRFGLIDTNLITGETSSMSVSKLINEQ